MSEQEPLADSAACVVIGGGVAGASVAHHLAALGMRDVVVLEQHDLTEGTTWHSAGLVGGLGHSLAQTRINAYSAELYARLAAEPGPDPGWRGVGGLLIARTPERVEALRRGAATASTHGLPIELLSPAEAQERLPLLEIDDVLGAAWLTGDGYVDPGMLTRALAAAAEANGVRFHTGVRVTGFELDRDRIVGVRTRDGSIATGVVVIAAGAASSHLGRLAGASIPIVPVHHQYVVTDPLDPAAPADAPTVRDPDGLNYFRPEAGGLLVGGHSREPAACEEEEQLREPRLLFDRDMERFAEAWHGAQRRAPALAEVGIAKVVNGPEAFTPDGEFILGETAEVAGLWVAAGFCTRGIAAAGGAGRAIAESIVEGRPWVDVSAMDPRRFGRHFAVRPYSRIRALDAYARHDDIAYPGEEREAGRPLRLPPAYDRLQGLDARFGEKAGWERVNWFDSNAVAGNPSLRPDGWPGRNWSPAIGTECIATRDAAGVFDRSSSAKLDVWGRGAAAALGRICANEVDVPTGSAVHTQMLNEHGGIEADLTVTRLGEESFRIVTGAAAGTRTLAWIRRHLPADGTVQARDVTSSRACFSIWGPLAREILQPLTDADISDAAHPLLRARQINVGLVPVLAQRVTSVGELGWELYCPVECASALWDMLWAAGRPHGMRPGGYRAIDSMRLEKGYRVWGRDITPTTTPDEAGLGFAVALDKQGGFIGRDALLRAREAGGPATRLRCLLLDEDRSICFGDEPARIGADVVGRVTSGGFGNRVGASVAYAYLPAELGVGTQVELGIFGSWVGAAIAEEPLYDPKMERMLA